MLPKPVVWIGSSHDDLRALPEAVQDDLGFALYEIQLGEFPADAKQMHGSLRDVIELITDGPGGAYRLACVVTLGEAVYVLHVFQKKAKRGIATPRTHLELIERRLRLARIKHEARNH